MAGLLSKDMVAGKTLNKAKEEKMPGIWDTEEVTKLYQKLGQRYPGDTLGNNYLKKQGLNYINFWLFQN